MAGHAHSRETAYWRWRRHDVLHRGFVVTVIGGTNGGLSTAGHCPSPSTYTNVQLTREAKAESLNADVAWYDNPVVSWDATFWIGASPNVPVYGRRYRNDMFINDQICRYGKNSGATCGYVTSKSYCPSYIPNCAYSFGVLTPASQPGDSGGPIFFGNAAYGILSGSTGSNQTIFTFLDFLESRIGVRAKVQ